MLDLSEHQPLDVLAQGISNRSISLDKGGIISIQEVSWIAFLIYPLRRLAVESLSGKITVYVRP